LLDDLRWALVGRSRDPEADLRYRIACGLAVGELGDPRFERRVGPFGEYLMPPMVEIAGGVYPIGDDELIHWIMPGAGTETDGAHIPRHCVTIAAFRIGQFPITNAEWACFIAAGGYEDERFWDTPSGRAWRRGENTVAAIHLGIKWFFAECRKNPEVMVTLLDTAVWDEETYERTRRCLAMSDAELEAYLHERYPEARFSEPLYWRDDRFNNPAQPVVGVCWFEARAYLCWLSAQSGRAFRLPTEVEWEATARGPDGRRFAFGDAFDPVSCNTAMAHVRRPSPVGVFMNGDTPHGVGDMSGNTTEWTSSSIGTLIPDGPAMIDDFSYPYDPADGRESAEILPTSRMVHRGGSSNEDPGRAIAYQRSSAVAVDRVVVFGVRAVEAL